jgi:hypothetical protein
LNEPQSTTSDRETASARDEVDRLRLAASLSIVYLIVVAAGAAVGSLLLLDRPRSDDLQAVATLALAGGALGAAVRGIYETIESAMMGWELADGTLIARKLLREERAREKWEAEHGETLARLQAEALAADSARDDSDRRAGLSREPKARLQELERERDDFVREAAWASDYFGLNTLADVIVRPIVGAALGLAAFAGVAGGFLVATGAQEADYSPTGLLFIAFLAGLFAESFIKALSRAADALFATGSTDSTRQSDKGTKPDR